MLMDSDPHSQYGSGSRTGKSVLIRIHSTGRDIILVVGAGREGSEVCGGDHVDAHGGWTGGGQEHYLYLVFMFPSIFLDPNLAGWSPWWVACII
jgi:hypothetical protein